MPQITHTRFFGLAAASLASVALAACAQDGDLNLESGVGITATRGVCPGVAVPHNTNEVTLFAPGAQGIASGIDVTAAITDLRGQCNDQGAQVYSLASFDVQASRRDPRGARQVTLPYYAVVVQGGQNVVSKELGQVTLNFADGEWRTSTSAQASAYIDRAAATLPADVEALLTRRRDADDPDATIDPMTIPAVREAVTRASFELLVGFQLDQDQIRYNITR